MPARYLISHKAKRDRPIGKLKVTTMSHLQVIIIFRSDLLILYVSKKVRSLPADLFWWEGADGTRVLTYRIQVSYNEQGSERNRIERILGTSKDQPMKSFMAYFCTGGHGGGATKENIRSIEELKDEKDAPEKFFSTTDNYFKEVRTNKDLKLPVVQDDLQHHAIGCYTAESAIKKGNRQSEAALVTAEKIAAVGSSVWKGGYPIKKLTAAWKGVLFLQYHDIMC